MMARFPVLIAGALGAALIGAGAVAAPKLTTYEPDKGIANEPTDQPDDLRFKLDRYARMTVPVRFSGRGPYRFLVDTGADRTAVSTDLASELGLEAGADAILHSASGAAKVRTATVRGLELGSGAPRQVQAPLLEAVNMGADGILGIDTLRSQRVLFDFSARTISIVPSEQRLSRYERGTIVVTGKLRNGHLIVTRARSEGVPTTVILDTGAETTIGNAALYASLAKRRMLRDPLSIEMVSVTGGKLKGQVHVLEEVEIGGVTLSRLAVMFADSHSFRALGLDQRPALLLGMNAMRAFDRVSIDFDNKKLRFAVPRERAARGMLLASRAAATPNP
jgi:predicted aspartyl protease